MSAGQRVKSTDDLIRYHKALRDDRALRTFHPDAKLAVFCLAERYPDIRPGYNLLAEDMGRSRRQAIYAVKSAIEAGWLVETYHGTAVHDASRYALCFPTKAGHAAVGDKTGAQRAPVNQSEQPTSACGAPELVHSVHPKRIRRTQENRDSPLPGGGSSRGRRWSAEDDEYLKEQIAAGVAVEVIAEKIGRSPGAVRSRLAKGITAKLTEPAAADTRTQIRRFGYQPGMRFRFSEDDLEIELAEPHLQEHKETQWSIIDGGGTWGEYHLHQMVKSGELIPVDSAQPDRPAPEPDFLPGLSFKRLADSVVFTLDDADYDEPAGEHLWHLVYLGNGQAEDVYTSVLVSWSKAGAIKEIPTPATEWTPPACTFALSELGTELPRGGGPG